MAAEVPNSTVVLRLNFCAKLNICASISATSPSRKPLPAIFMKLAIFIVFFFISNSVIGNSVDSIQTDSDVLAFLKRIDNRFTSDKYRQLQIFPTPQLDKN